MSSMDIYEFAYLFEGYLRSGVAFMGLAFVGLITYGYLHESTPWVSVGLSFLAGATTAFMVDLLSVIVMEEFVDPVFEEYEDAYYADEDFWVESSF